MPLEAQLNSHTIGKFKEAPKIDGILDEWDAHQSLVMSKPNVDDLRVDKALVAWDDNNIYVAMSMSDRAMINDNELTRLQMGDNMDFRVAQHKGQVKTFRLCIAPTTNTKKPGMKLYLPDKSVITDDTGEAKNGIKWAVNVDGNVWSVEASIPKEALDIKLEVGKSYPFVFVVWDRDRTDKDDWNPWWRRSQFGPQKKRPKEWPMLIFQEEAPKAEAAKPTISNSKQARSSKSENTIAINVSRNKPCNLFTPGESVSFNATLNSGLVSKGELIATVTDYFGKTVAKQTFTIQLPDSKEVALPFEQLPRGYYELNLKAAVKTVNGKTVEGSQKVCFAVADLTRRTASEVRQGNYRFGLKMYYLRNAWWAGNADWDEREVVDAMSKLGLQWTRVLLQQTSHLSTEEIVKAYPMNAIFKVERFPRELYDAQRYGPIEEYERKYGRGAWTLKTLPQKEPYQAWLKQVLTTVPPEQKVYEIWNEAWDKMSPEDLATLSNWITEVILAERPDAIIGANLRGSTSKYEYDAKFIEAGGMKGMKMVALHPYSEAENRLWLREYRQWVSDQMGYPIDIYVTEYGSHSCPQGPARRSENEQAQRVVRQSLALYAEDVKALTPHWAGQREHNPTYHEDWFGFVRLNHEPKPVLIAHAVSGRMIDASRYVGDLFYDQGVESLLFERNGQYTLAIWTQDGEKNITVNPGVSQLTQVDIVGKQSIMQVQDDKLQVTASPNVIYLVGVSPKLKAKATTKLDPARWADEAGKVRLTRHLPKANKPIVADGKITEWSDSLQLYMTNPKVNGKDASGQAYMSWDQNNLYIAVDMRDNEMLNNRPLNKIYQQDSIELFISAEPRENNPGYGPNDYQFMVTPTSMLGKPLRVKITDREAGKSADVSGDTFYAGKTQQGWVAEFAIPWSEISGFVPSVGSKIAMELRVNDADTSHERWKIDAEGVVVRPSDPTSWSYFIFK
tara:strand:- start:78815 stop:81694 length:2880 start_codon:yes stop_codon:yes gene_type:complete